ncbi:hypothetical protein AMTRI_Chr05g73860 [Amborella trichopoda]
MAKDKHHLYIPILFQISIFLVVFLVPPSNGQLQTSYIQSLLRIKRILEYPLALNNWNRWTYFCNIPPTSNLTVICSNSRVTELHIVGDKGSPTLLSKGNLKFASSNQSLSSGFSMDSLFTTLSKFSDLQALSLVSLGLWGEIPGKIDRLSNLQVLNMSSNFLYGGIPQEISSIPNLQTLILDDNILNDIFPNWVNLPSNLSVLSLSDNSIHGLIPSSLGTSKGLRLLNLSRNSLSGNVPYLGGLSKLEVLDLGENNLGPQFPSLGKNIVTLALRNNTFSANIPSELGSYAQLKRLDLSFNKLVGPILVSLFSLTSIQYLNLAGNKLTGSLVQNLSCNKALEYLDISDNLLTGKLPSCLEAKLTNMVSLYGGNCLVNSDQHQHPYSFCQNEALAAIMPHVQKKESKSNLALILSILGGIVGGLVMLVLSVLLILRRMGVNKGENLVSQKTEAVNSSMSLSPRLTPNSRSMPQMVRLGTIGLPPFRKFSLEEIEDATDNFDSSNLIGEGSQGQLYRGMLHDGSMVLVKCLKLKQRQSPQSIMQRVELISNLRHRHLISILGHCFMYYQDSPGVSGVFLVFEYVYNGTLRSHISERREADTLKWPQRIAAAIGVARGLQFLNTGITPGIYRNNLKIEDILLDQNTMTKLCSYNLPIIEEIMVAKVGSESSFKGQKESMDVGRANDGDKEDVYNLGQILAEIIVGKPIISPSELEKLRNQLQASFTAEPGALRRVADPSIRYACATESLKTAIGITLKCLSKDISCRPSVDDVIWNLQYAAQVQDGWSGSAQVSGEFSMKNLSAQVSGEFPMKSWNTQVSGEFQVKN